MTSANRYIHPLRRLFTDKYTYLLSNIIGSADHQPLALDGCVDEWNEFLIVFRN